MATSDQQCLDLKDTFGSKCHEERKNSRLGKRTEEEIREEHRTLRVLHKLEGLEEHQNQLFKVVTSIERVVCRTTSEEGQEIDNHSHDQSHTSHLSVDANSLTQEQISLQLDEKNQKIENLNETVEEHKEQIVVLKGEVRQLSEERDQLSGDSETNKARIEELQTKVTVKNEKIKEIKKEKSALIKSIEENHGAVKELTIQLKYKTNLVQLQWELHKLSDTAEQNSILKERCSIVEEEQAKKDVEIEDLKREREDVYAEMNAQRIGREDHSKELQQKTDENGILRNQLSEKETRTKVELEEASCEMAKVLEKLASAESALLAGAEASKITAKKQEELDLAKKEIEQLRKAIKREDDEKEKKTVELDETSLEITSLDPQPEQSS
ncbi:uncharacterized protein LOC128210097 isoform X2 [Mya arenaria]|uniref:uncharacterized protein LOC128210097 isoform X2 n=1 Tax=Mya arenaria TaxID=6604 RepID=UPI0022E550BE|nr:uncharacterized protein LOC128210097 isoform X2 [Mya arenaria]